MTAMGLEAADRALVVGAPLAGWAYPLDEVPDPVFAERMLGDGLAIDPTGDVVVAPFDAVLVSVHAARHAVTLRSAEGVEVLVHLGIDSVALGGAGIEVLAAEGAAVKAGQPLLSFDLDALVTGARAAVTPVIVAGDYAVEPIARGLVKAGDPLFRVLRRGSSAGPAAGGGERISRTVRLALPHGIHARPAARISAAVGKYSAEVEVLHGESRAPASAALALLRLSAGHGATVTIEASGPDASAALEAVEAVLLDAAPEAGPVPASTPVQLPPGGPGLRGVSAAPGLGIGPAFHLRSQAPSVFEAAGDPACEAARFDTALSAAQSGLAEAARAPGAAGEVLAAQLAFLDDPMLHDQVRSAIAEGAGAAAAWRAAIETQIELLAAAQDSRIAGRVADLRDIEMRLLSQLAGEAAEEIDVPAGSVLLARDLFPSQVAGLDPAKVAGIALGEGGPTSHAAILAAGKGIPMAVAFGAELDAIGDGTILALDGERGVIEVDPSAERVKELESRQVFSQDGLPGEPCRTADGERIEIFANLGSLADAEAAVAAGAEGCGLLRTEFLFLDRTSPPDEAEQRTAYQAIADVLGERPLVVRLLDVGGDKPAPYLSIPAEENPALGLRGIRVGLARPKVLETQLRAILSVEPPGRCRIMPPMVASLSELEAVAAAVERIRSELGIDVPVELGVMVETPAAALTADLLSRRAAFLSIGSNDLAQYALAMDRGNAALAASVDSLHPAVLRLIAAACEGAEGCAPVGVCGGLAADRCAVPILLGLGVTELSVPPARVPMIGSLVRGLSIAGCRELAVEALQLDSAGAVRARADAFLEGSKR